MREALLCTTFPFRLPEGPIVGYDIAHVSVYGSVQFMVNPDNLRARFAKLQIWHANGQRAPNKPLLALWAIGRCLKGESRTVSYRDADQALTKLLRRFGPPRKKLHPEFPFWRLQNDDVWEVRGKNRITVSRSGDAHVSSLLREDARGGFPPDVFAALQADEKLAVEIAYSLVDAHFPPTLHDDVLQAVGIQSYFEVVRRRPRNPAFSNTVLTAYGHRCVVCDFAVRLGNDPIALEAAHIKWHRARGPDQIRNALALCSLHHELFDAGAFTLGLDRRVVVATSLAGSGLDDALGRYESKEVSAPASADDLPDPKFLKWHHQQVFKTQIHAVGQAPALRPQV